MARVWAVVAALAVGLPGAVVATEKPAEAAPSKPDWCGKYKSSSDEKAKWVRLDEGWHSKNRNYMALGACDKPDDAKRQAMVEEWRKQYIADFGGTAKDFSEMLAVYIDDEEAQKQLKDNCTKLPGSPGTAQRLHEFFNCPTDSFASNKNHSIEDRPTMTQLSSLVLAKNCLGSIQPGSQSFSSRYVFHIAPCWTDVETLDRAKLETEIGGFNAATKARFRETFGLVKAQADFLKTKIAEATASNAEMKKILIDAPKEGFAAWKATYTAHKEAMDAAYEVLDKNERDPATVKGCETKMQDHVSAYLAEKRPTTYEEAKKAALDEVGLPLTTALMHCALGDGHPITALSIYKSIIVHAKRAHEGPRAAVYAKILDAFGAAPDAISRSSFPHEATATPREPVVPKSVKLASGRHSGDQFYELDSQIATLKPLKDGTGTLVSFKKVTTKDYEETCADAKPLRIESIGEHGTIYYKQNCWQTGKFTTTTTGQAPVVVPPGYDKGLSVGQTLVFNAEEKDKGRVGLPVGGYSDKDRKHLVSFLGVRLGAPKAAAEAKTPAKRGKKPQKVAQR